MKAATKRVLGALAGAALLALVELLVPGVVDELLEELGPTGGSRSSAGRPTVVLERRPGSSVWSTGGAR